MYYFPIEYRHHLYTVRPSDSDFKYFNIVLEIKK